MRARAINRLSFFLFWLGEYKETISLISPVTGNLIFLKDVKRDFFTLIRVARVNEAFQAIGFQLSQTLSLEKSQDHNCGKKYGY